MTRAARRGKLFLVNIKIHPDTRRLLDEINAKRAGKIVKPEELARARALRKGTSGVETAGKLRRADLDGRGGPM